MGSSLAGYASSSERHRREIKGPRMKPTRLPEVELKPVEPAGLVLVRYRDRVLFRDSDSSKYQPWQRETCGWLDAANDEFVRIVWERYVEPNGPENARVRSTGLTILRSTIVSRHNYGTALFPGLVTVKASVVGRGRFELPTMRPRKASACKADVLSRAY